MLRVIPASYRPRRLAALLDWTSRAWRRARQRRALAALDDARLADLGLSRAAAEAEAAKPFWRA